MTKDEIKLNILVIVARTALRIERNLLAMDKEKTEQRVLAHNDECIRLRGLMGEL